MKHLHLLGRIVGETVLSMVLLLFVGGYVSTGVTATIVSPSTVPFFETELPKPGVYSSMGTVQLTNSTSVPHYHIIVAEVEQDVGLSSDHSVLTRVWGYGMHTQDNTNPFAAVTYPGGTFETTVNNPIAVTFYNRLPPFQHLLANAIDRTVGTVCARTDTDMMMTTMTMTKMAMDPAASAANDTLPCDDVRIATHLHGGHTLPQFDGQPEEWIYSGQHFFHYFSNNQQPATLWYHDHAMLITRLNVYSGLAGFYILRSEEEKEAIASLKLPQSPFEFPVVLQDRDFTESGELKYPDAPWSPEFFGSFIVVNGKVWPKMTVQPVVYRLRLLNGANSRFFRLSLVVDPLGTGARADRSSLPALTSVMYQIGGDDGFLNEPVARPFVLLGPAERADLLIDFTEFAGRNLTLRNNAPTPFMVIFDQAQNGNAVNPMMMMMMGHGAAAAAAAAADADNTNHHDERRATTEPSFTNLVMQFQVLANKAPGIKSSRRPKFISSLPKDEVNESEQAVADLIVKLRRELKRAAGAKPDGTDPLARIIKRRHITVREVILGEKALTNDLTIPLIGSNAVGHLQRFMDPPSEFPIAGKPEIWTIINTTPDVHPMHWHSTSFMILYRQPFDAAVFTPGNAPILLNTTVLPEAHESAFKDTVLVYPHTVARILMVFDLAGRYVFHCHILEHEDFDMMRPFVTLPYLPAAPDADSDDY